MTKFNFEFIPQGAQIKITDDYFEFIRRKNNSENETVRWSKKNTIILDTGNNLLPGIIDHHQPDSNVAESCVTSLVVHDAEKYISHLKDQDEILIITHFIPDLDAIGSVYFTKKYLENNDFDANDRMIADYILEVDSGKLSIDPENPESIASIWLAITNQRNNQLDNLEIVKIGLDFFDKISKRIQTIPSPWNISFIETITGFDEQIKQIHQDIEDYKQDFTNKSTCFTIDLFNLISGGKDKLDVIFTSQPSSFLWKYWVRGDRKRSPNKEGFIVTCAHLTRRSIISVDPNTPYNLKGLGLLIDHAEVEILQQTNSFENIELGPLNDSGKRSGKRDGFHRNDPWYDGRGFHNFTIIDSPRDGTNLTEKELQKLILSTEIWQFYGTYLDEKIDINNGINSVLKNFTLSELTSLPLPEKSNINYLKDLDLPSSFDLIDLSEECQIKNITLLKNVRFQVKYDSLTNFWYRENCDNYISLLCNGLNSLPTDTFFDLKNKLAIQIAEDLDNESVKLFLLTAKDLPIEGVLKCLTKVKKIILHSKYMYFLMDIQNLHPKTFHLNDKTIFENIKENNFDSITIYPSKIDEQYELPLYSYNKLKNYFDDLIVCSEYANKVKIEYSNEFIATDFNNNFNDEEIGNVTILQTNSDYTILKGKLFEQLFKNNLEEIRTIRNDTIKSTKGIVAKTVKQNSIDELLELNYSDIKKLIKTLRPEIQNESSEYLNLLNFLEIITSITNLQLRLSNFSKLKSKDFEKHFIGNQFLVNLNNLIYNLFYSQAIYLQYSSSDDVEVILNKCIGQINILRTIQDQSPEIVINDFSELLVEFINNLLTEINLPLENITTALENNTNQYQLITKNEGFISTITNTFPVFYQSFLLEIFVSYKRYYAEKIYFLREEMIRLVELSDSPEEEKASIIFNKLSIEIINNTISYDWQELKDQIDSEINVNKDLFYKKYFSWHSLNFEKSTNIDALAILNSKIRFAIGKSKGDINQLIKGLPEPLPLISNTELQRKMVYKAKSNLIISHFPNKFLHQSFDFVSKLYINKFDVDSAKKGLLSYSTEFPFYYVWLSRTNVLRLISFILIFMLFLVGCFDSNLYQFKTTSEHAPIAKFMMSIFDKSTFNLLSNLISGFWIIILSLSFTLPIIIFALLVKNQLIKSKSSTKNIQFKFVELIQNTESNRSNLLYFSFVVPLIFVVVQMASSDTIDMINNITGIRLISTLIIIIGLTISAVYMHVREKNKYKNTLWLLKKTEHMFWLHILQALLITIFIIDLMLRLDVSINDFGSPDDLFSAGISKFIKLEIGPFDFIIMPIFTLLVALLTLFFSFFIDKVLGSKE
jgi:hypothetical protein